MLVVKHRKSPDVILLQIDALHLNGLDLTGAYLPHAALAGCRARGTRFRGATLRSADLQEADLRRADLREANLSGAELRGVDLRGADLRGADLAGVDLAGVRHDRRTRWPAGCLVEQPPGALECMLSQVRAWFGGVRERPGGPGAPAFDLRPAASLGVAALLLAVGLMAARTARAPRVAPHLARASSTRLSQAARPAPPVRSPAAPVRLAKARQETPGGIVRVRRGGRRKPRRATGAPRQRSSSPRRRPRLLERSRPRFALRPSGRGLVRPAGQSKGVLIARRTRSNDPRLRHPPPAELQGARQPSPTGERRTTLAAGPAEPSATARRDGDQAQSDHPVPERPEPMLIRYASRSRGFHYGSGYDVYRMHLRGR